MKKNVTIVFALVISNIAYSQIGFNTKDPKATIDIVAKNATGTSSSAEGILIPRVDRQRAQSMTNVETSTLIYVTSISTGTQTGIAININAVGYYYFNGSVWVKLNEGANTNIYTDDGDLTTNRTVTNGARTLAFTGTAVNMFSVDDTTFSVDAANNRVGIGTTTPQNHLDLGSDMGTSITDAKGKKLAIYNNTSGSAFYGLGISDKKLQFHAGSTTTAAPAMVLDSIGNVGIGTTDPTHMLHVNGTVRIVNGTQAANRVLTSDASGIATWKALPTASYNTLYNANGSLTSDRTVTQGDYTIAFTSSKQNGFSVDGTTFSVDAANNRVGIGTTAPKNKLDLGADFGSTIGAAAGKKLAVYNNADGSSFYGLGVSNNRLQFHAASVSTANPAMVLANTGNVGIGTTDPTASAALELSASDKGFLPPRMTTAQRDALNPKTPGLMVYNTDENCMQYWNSTMWKGSCLVTLNPNSNKKNQK